LLIKANPKSEAKATKQINNQKRSESTKQINNQKRSESNKAKMSNPRGFMEPIYEQNEDAGYDFSEEAYASDNAYYAKYGGNACLGCAGGSYIWNVDIIKTGVKNTYKNTIVFEEEDDYDEDDYEDDEDDYEDDDSNDY
jgi:hypothetical protein